jgi:threonine dehydratase
MPRPFTSRKRDAVEAYGGKVYEVEDRPRAEAKLREIAAEYGAVIVHAFNDPLVITGQGTIALELLEQAGEVDAILAPIGGGGLLSGLCLAAHGLQPGIEIFACEPAGALDAIESVRQNRVVPMLHPVTIADGLRSSLGDRTLPILREHLSDFFIVQEEEMVAAMRFAYERLKLVIEPSSAVALAPLLRREPRLAGKRVAVILTGGNVDLSCLWDGLRKQIEQERDPG